MIKIIIYTFLTVFIAELGDKTQLATMLISSQSSSKTAVFIGSSIALILAAFIGVACGSVLNKIIPPHLLQLSSGIAFIIIGLILIIKVL